MAISLLPSLRRKAAISLVLAGFLFSACSTGDSSDSTASGEDALDWTACYGHAECATLDVPVDYGEPDGDSFSLGIVRVPASGERTGALFINPGGPGGEVDEFAVGLAGALPPAITDRFDVVALDPRGLGESLIDCGYDYTELYGVDHTVDSPAEQQELLEVSRDYADSCADAVGDDLQHLGTRNVARDMDAAREAMGDEQLNYLGYSYGTVIGQVYAELFPDRVRTMVLDGVVELGPTGPESAEQQALGFERALEAFAQDCDGDPSCPLAPDALTAVRGVIDTVQDAPIPASPRDLGPGEVSLGMSMALYSDVLWPQLAGAVADARDGDGSAMVGLADQYLELASFDVYFAVNCLDFDWPDEPEELLAAADATAEQAPHFGEALVNDYIRCSIWPVSGEPLGAVTAPNAPPILVVSTTNDPATPYQSGVNVAETLESGVLLTYAGDTHGVVGTGVPCIDDAVAGYIVDLDVPEEGATC